MQRNLSRFTHGTHKQGQSSNGQQLPVSTGECHGAQFLNLGEHVAVVHGASVGVEQANTQSKTEVTHTVDQEGLHVGKNGSLALVPETDQQVRHQTHRFPTEEQLQHVVGHDQHQHREGKQRDVGEKALVARIIFHVANGVDMHHQRHGRHHHHHQGSQLVDQKADIPLNAANGDPGVDRTVEGLAFQNLQHDHDRADKGNQHARDRNQVSACLADKSTQKAGTEQTG